VWFALALLGFAVVGDTADPALTLRCPASQGTGRVRCTVEALAHAGTSISWADVVIVSTPPFTSVLRGRLAPDDAIDQSSDRWRWEFALAARTRGRGDVTVRVRAVVCVGQGACNPWHHEVTTSLVVGE
jgi:hypothetical protein